MTSENMIEEVFEYPEKIHSYVKRNTPVLSDFLNIGWHGIPFYVSKQYYKYIKEISNETYIWDRDWDLLIVLDACRADWFDQVASEYDFVSQTDTISSVGSHSEEWISKTFNGDFSSELSSTVYVTGNHYSTKIDTDLLRAFDDVRQYSAYPKEMPSPPASIVTDRAVSMAREHDWDRFIVHYMQPHKPFYQCSDGRYDTEWVIEETGWDIFRKMFSGELSKKTMHDLYCRNLRYVLDEVRLLLENIDAPTVRLTADHGQALGENFLYDHPKGVHHPAIKRVPWGTATATDERTLSPPSYTERNMTTEDIKNNLEALGYR